MSEPGCYLMDEPDAPLSCTACRVALLHDLARAGSRAVVATHSPIGAVTPGASILELGAGASAPPSWKAGSGQPLARVHQRP
ncbi:MAG: hypothetical protein ACLPN6_30185 [Streptosporangiaceae bacterium]|jgi:predicted ATPase|nr:hypothetical protein [Actinomycetota bacterium]